MKLPFSADEFLSVFERYNKDVWPIQIVFYILAALTVTMLFTEYANRHRIINSILAFFWIWMGIVYHILYFSSVNPAAILFGSLFIIQGLVFTFFGIYRKSLEFKFELNTRSIIGVLFLIYGLLIYPLLSRSFGRAFPENPTFGLPCPTTIYTFGILLLSKDRVAWYIIAIPFLWSLIGFSAATNLHIKEDFFLVVAGIASTFILLFQKPKPAITGQVL